MTRACMEVFTETKFLYTQYGPLRSRRRSLLINSYELSYYLTIVFKYMYLESNQWLPRYKVLKDAQIKMASYTIYTTFQNYYCWDHYNCTVNCLTEVISQLHCVYVVIYVRIWIAPAPPSPAPPRVPVVPIVVVRVPVPSPVPVVPVPPVVAVRVLVRVALPVSNYDLIRVSFIATDNIWYTIQQWDT